MHRWLAFALLFVFRFAQATEQHATVQQLEVKRSNAGSGAAEYDISGTIRFERSMDDYRNQGDSAVKTYMLTIRFKQGNKPVMVNMGLGNQWGDDAGELWLQKVQKLSMNDVYNYDFTFSLPVSAISLPEGKHSLVPVINLVDEATGRYIIANKKISPVDIDILPVAKIRLWVKYILADSLDADGNLWDYFVLNPVDGNPDIYWSLDYAGQTYFSSKVRRNVFEYFDKDKLETYELTISKGDSMVITVKDRDDLTTDDLIGTVVVAPFDPKHLNGAVVTAKAGQIKRLDYVIEVLP
jgi:hypothetical protein